MRRFLNLLSRGLLNRRHAYPRAQAPVRAARLSDCEVTEGGFHVGLPIGTIGPPASPRFSDSSDRYLSAPAPVGARDMPRIVPYLAVRTEHTIFLPRAG